MNINKYPITKKAIFLSFIEKNPFLLHCSLLRENLVEWNDDLQTEHVGSTSIDYHVRERQQTILRAPLMQVTENQVLLHRDYGSLSFYSLDYELDIHESITVQTFCRKHPNLPIMFEYPHQIPFQHQGTIIVTTEVLGNDFVPAKSIQNAQYNKGLSCTVKNSSRKRLWKFESDSETDEEEKSSQLLFAT